MEELRILMLEDVPFDAELAERELEQGNLKFSSLRVETKEEFKKGIKEFKPHVILADHSLPHFDGKSALKIANQMRPQAPFIFVSGKIGEEFAVEVLRDGAKDYVFKNNISKLPYAVKRALNEVNEANERQKAGEALEKRETQLRLITENIQDMVMQLDEDHHIQYLSSSINKILGYDYHDFLGQPMSKFFELLHPSDQENMISTLEKICTIPTSDRQEFRCQNRYGDYIWLESLANPLFDDKIHNKGCVFVIRDISSRKKVEFELERHRGNLEKVVEERTQELTELTQKLRNEIEERKTIHKNLQNSEKRLESIINGSPIPTFVIDNDHKLVYWNLALEELTGIKKDEVIGSDKQWIAFYPEKRPCMADILLTQKQGNISNQITASYIPSKLLEDAYETTNFFEYLNKWLYITTSTIRDSDHEIIGAVETIEDITEEVKDKKQIEASLSEKEVLLREIHHRVKNNLQIISSLINLQSNRIEDPETLHLFQKNRNRIRSMAMVHEKLYQSGDLTQINLSEYLRDLVLDILRSYENVPDRIKLKTDLEAIWIDINTAIPCGLIINELVTNTIKHAFPTGESGEIRIGLQKVDDKLVLTFADDGVGIPDEVNFHQTQTLGLKMVKVLTQQLDGEIEILKNKGTLFKISITA
ncbi:MAG TPA: PAS domain S-box protein [Methanobacteriaceae archaeon]|nr:PAS domain S-box protein [Methanobacteriaceae archaeon]